MAKNSYSIPIIYTEQKFYIDAIDAATFGLTENLTQLLYSNNFSSYIKKDLLNQCFLRSCEKGHLDITKVLLCSPQMTLHADIHANNDQGLRSAVANNHFTTVDFLLTGEELKSTGKPLANIHANNEESLLIACEKGYLDLVTYLTNSSKLSNHADINTANGEPLITACRYGHEEVAMYLLTHKKINTNGNYQAFMTACETGCQEVVGYLTALPSYRTLSNWKDIIFNGIVHACKGGQSTIFKQLYDLQPCDLHLNNDQIFSTLWQYSNSETLQYLLYDLDMDITPAMYQHAKQPPASGNLPIWEKRILKEKLQNNLKVKKNKNNNHKI